MSRYHDHHRLRDLRDDRRGYYDSRKSARKGQVGKVLTLVVMIAVGGLIVSRMGCHAERSAYTLPPKKNLAGLKPKDLQQQTAEYGIEGGAVAGMKIVAGANEPVDLTGEYPDPDPEVTSTGFVVRKVRSIRPHVLPADRGQAILEAESEARRVLIEKGYVAPNEWKVSYDPKGVRNIVPDKPVQDEWEAKGLGTDRGWVEIDVVTLTHETVRAENAKDRSAQAGFWFGTAFLTLLAAYGFLRLDMWTKGYLTLALGIIVGVVVVAAVISLAVVVF